MTGVLEQTQLMTLLAAARAIQQQLQDLDFSCCGEDEVVRAVRANEELRRGLETVDHALIMSVEQLGIPARSGSRSTANWLRNTVRVDIHEANARVAAARAAGPRRSLLGERLAPLFPVVAAGQAAGVVGAKQARVITRMLGTLPAAVVEEIPAVEARLVGFCTSLDAHQLTQCAAREREHLDPTAGTATWRVAAATGSCGTCSVRTGRVAGRLRGPRSSRSSCRSCWMCSAPRNPPRTGSRTRAPPPNVTTTGCWMRSRPP